MHRGWMDHPVFDSDEPFTERTAWVWLIENAAWQPVRKRVSGRMIELQRGQLVGSARYLAEVWRWSKSRVDRFLKRLAAEHMIGTDAGHGASVITLCNYEKYQVDAERRGTGAGQQRDSSGTPTGTAAGQPDTVLTRSDDDEISDQRDSSEPLIGTAANRDCAKSGTNKNERKKESPIGDSKTRATPPSDAEFDLWYAGYPHKVGRGTARTAYRRARTKATAEALLIGRDFYVRSKPPDRAWCNPATWLNGERWLDQPDHPTERRPDEIRGRKPSATESIFAGFAIALGERERAADRGADRDAARALLDAGDGPGDPLASRH